MTTHPHTGSPRSRAEADRTERDAEYDRQIDQLADEFHARLPRQQARSVGAIYARFSSKYERR